MKRRRAKDARISRNSLSLIEKVLMMSRLFDRWRHKVFCLYGLPLGLPLVFGAFLAVNSMPFSKPPLSLNPTEPTSNVIIEGDSWAQELHQAVKPICPKS